MSTPTQDPFSTRTAVATTFASLASFRGRLVLVEPTLFEADVPGQEPGKFADRVTATITVIDGSEVDRPVELFPQGYPSGQYLPGNRFEGVWISQDRVVKNLRTDAMARGTLLPMVIGKFETFKPGAPAKKGNPWGMDYVVTEADKQIARDFLAKRYAEQAAAAVGGAAAAVAAAVVQESAATPAKNPFTGAAPF
jgi:hypothetical protein